MALSTKLAPQPLTPVYNNVIAVVTSTEKNEDGFQYVFDIKDGTTGLRLSRLKLPANLDGYGVLDAQRILESQVSVDVFPSMVGWSAATNSFFQYNLEFGQEFTHTFNFKDNIFNGGRVGFTGSTPHYFASGDTVLIAQNPTGATYSQYDGVHTIYQVIDNYSFVIDQTFLGSTPAEAGTAVYSDYRKTLFTGLTDSKGNYVVNGAMKHQDFRQFNAGNYVLQSGTPASFLSTVPDGWKFDLDSQAYLLTFQTGGTNAKFLKVTLDNGNKYFITNPAPTAKALAVGVGTWNINNAGLGTIINSSISSYSVEVTNSASAATSQAITFNVYSPCAASNFTQYQIVGLDRLGSMVSFNFDLASKRQDDIKKDEFKKYVGAYNPTSNTWGFNSYDRGRTVNNVDVTSTYTVTSDWVEEEQVQYLAELYSSPEVYHIDSAGNWLAIIVTNTSFEHKYRNKEKVFNYTMTFEYANRDGVQRE